MPIVLDSQTALRPIQSLPFCYLCGRTFEDGEATNRDHVPPSAIFAVADRNFPLILRTHTTCNGDRSGEDAIIGQLVSVLHGRQPHPRAARPRVETGRFEDGTIGLGAVGVDLKGIIWRWVRGFHAALYQEAMPYGSRYSGIPPLPEGRIVGARVEPVPLAEVTPEFVEEIKRNRVTRTLDTIVCRNGRCRYECVWSQADNGRRICIWALDLYGWRELGEQDHFDPRGCVGSYSLPDHAVPPRATLATTLDFPVDNRDKLNPFGV